MTPSSEIPCAHPGLDVVNDFLERDIQETLIRVSAFLRKQPAQVEICAHALLQVAAKLKKLH
jgi:hypothetical protein